MSEQKNKLLEVKDLKVSFFTPAGEVKAVGGISYDLDYGEVMGFWKIIATLFPRNAVISSLEKERTSFPSKVMEPPITLPGD